MLDVTVQPATIGDKVALDRVMQLYMHDSSEYTGADVDEAGYYLYYYFDRYWTEDGRFPFIIRVNGVIAGLAFVRQLEFGDDPLFQLAEFFVMRKYRRQGAGRQAAYELFDHYQGRWEVQQEAGNSAGQAFWRRIIDDYTGGNFAEEWREEEDHRGPVQFFHSRRVG